MDRRCHNCGTAIGGQAVSYILRLELFARGDAPELTLDDLRADHTAQIEKLIEEMEHLDVEEATDEVYEAYNFELCSECRARIHELLKSRARSHKVQ